ncbi:hypothetical protein Hanom_Chr01g00078461 [Helianthus anomalus]
MVIIQVVEMGVKWGIEFDSKEFVFGQLGGVDHAEKPTGGAEGVVVGGEEEGYSVTGGGYSVGVLGGERGGGVGGGVEEGAGGGGDAGVAGEADDADSEVGVADEREVLERERERVGKWKVVDEDHDV